MTELAIDIGRTALVQIDLQNFNVKRELAPHPAERVVGNCVLLASEMRDRGGMVIFVRVLLDELLSLPADNPMRKPGTPAPPPEASHMAPEAQVQATDHMVTKRQWGAFVQIRTGERSTLATKRIAIAGDMADTASRRVLAPRDEVWVSDAALSGSEMFFETELVPQVTLKGKALPMTLYRVNGRSDVQTRFEATARRGLTAFVDRVDEMGALLSSVRESSSGRGSLMVITGAAGIGKTRLLAEFTARATKLGATVLRGACDSYGELAPLEAVYASAASSVWRAGEHATERRRHRLSNRSVRVSVRTCTVSLRCSCSCSHCRQAIAPHSGRTRFLRHSAR